MGIEARRSPRYSRQLSVDVDGLEIVTTNVARGGVQLCCPAMRYRGLRQTEKDGTTTIRLRIAGSDIWVIATGKSRYANLSGDEYLIGFQFTGFNEGTDRDWSAYIETLAAFKPID